MKNTRKDSVKQKGILLTAIVGFLCIFVFAFPQTHSNKEVLVVSDTPTAELHISTPPTPTNPPTPEPKPFAIPNTVQNNVPFTSQAPFGTWDLPFQEYCEEASVLMAMRYLSNEPISSPDDAFLELQEIQTFEEETFGYYESTTLTETERIIREHYGNPNTYIIENPSIQDIKIALAQKKLVIVPAAGRSLNNPHFTPPGPVYHMLVVTGYTEDGMFVTNDPGTRHGKNYLYPQSVLMNAIRDWVLGGTIETGASRVLVVG